MITMEFIAEIRYNSTNELVVTGTTDGKSDPDYRFEVDVDVEVEVALVDTMTEAYAHGLYGTGSPGEVRDMLYAMQVATEQHTPFYKLVIPRATQDQVNKEVKAQQKLFDQGIVF